MQSPFSAVPEVNRTRSLFTASQTLDPRPHTFSITEAESDKKIEKPVALMPGTAQPKSNLMRVREPWEILKYDKNPQNKNHWGTLRNKFGVMKAIEPHQAPKDLALQSFDATHHHDASTHSVVRNDLVAVS